jgi:hypothetical protein
MTLRDIPESKVLCMDSSCIGALNVALAQKWPSFYMNPKIRLMTLNKSLREIPSSTKIQLTVSPSNSCGRLDGGFDDAISKRFCLPHHPYETLMKAAQRVLYEKWRGFAPPGTCTLVHFPQELGKNDWAAGMRIGLTRCWSRRWLPGMGVLARNDGRRILCWR